MTKSPTTITAITTAYHPDARLLDVILAAGHACAEVVVVDNTPGGSDLLGGGLPPSVRVLRAERNLGLAGALNRGLSVVAPEAELLLLLDQDSVLSGEMIERLAAHLADPGVGAAAPAPWDAERSSYIDPRTVLRAEVADRDVVITSGMLVRRSLAEQLGGFREEFFLDCVDQDFCLRLRRSGKRIVQDKRVAMPHSLGAMREHRLLIGRVRVTHHPAWRLYWVLRNSTVLMREHFRHAPRWCLAWMLIMLRWVLLTAIYERPRRARLLAIWRGLLDGARGRMDRSYLPADALAAGPVGR
jgi:rhamnosyltransferase